MMTSQWYVQHRLPCFNLRLDTTSTRYSEIQSKPVSVDVSRDNSHSTIMKFGLAQILWLCPKLDLSVLHIMRSVSIFSLQCTFWWSVIRSTIPGACCTRRTFGGGQGGRDLREGWDESCLRGGWRLPLEQCVEVNVRLKWFHRHHSSGVWSHNTTWAVFPRAARTL